MSIVHQVVGARSKYNRDLPYTYTAKVYPLNGESGFILHYHADTICGLIEYLAEYRVDPAEVQLFGIYRDRELQIDKELCLGDDRNWLRRPEICKVLEEHFRRTMEKQYLGHTPDEPCSFVDRDRKGSGPY